MPKDGSLQPIDVVPIGLDKVGKNNSGGHKVEQAKYVGRGTWRMQSEYDQNV